MFVSHSGTDAWVAKQIAREIEACGARAFLAEVDLDVDSEDFEEDLRRALHRARELVVLLTPWALERPYLWAEVGAAWTRKKPIVGVLHGITPARLQSSPDVPIMLKKRVLISLNDVDRYFDRLKRKLALLNDAEELDHG